MSAVDWSKAPAWAKFAAMDQHGGWYWFEQKPTVCPQLGMFTAGGLRVEPMYFPNWEASAQIRGGAALPLPMPTFPRPEYESICEWSFEELTASGWTVEQMLAASMIRKVRA